MLAMLPMPSYFIQPWMIVLALIVGFVVVCAGVFALVGPMDDAEIKANRAILERVQEELRYNKKTRRKVRLTE